MKRLLSSHNYDMKSFLHHFLLFACLLCSPYAFAESLDKVSVQLSWRHQFQFAGFYAAQQQGYYKQAGLDVELIPGGPGSVACDERSLGSRVQFCVGSNSVVQRRVSGEKLAVLASIFQHSPAVLLTLKGSGLTTPESLIGKRVETISSTGSKITEIEAMFLKQGITLNQLQNKGNGYGTSALVNGEVDASFAYISNEPYLYKLEGIEVNMIKPIDYGVDFYGDVIITTEKELKENKRRAIRFRNATLQGWRYALKNPEQMVDYILDSYSTKKRREALLAEAKATKKLIMPNLIQVGHSNPERWQAIAQALVAVGVIQEDYSLEGLLYNAADDKASRTYSTLWLSVGLLFLCLIAGFLWSHNRRLIQEIKLHLKGKKYLQEAQQEAIKKAYTDEMTGLGNRRAYFEKGTDAVESAKKYKEPIAAVLLDIDHFKKVNDEYGHAVGDEVICHVANIMLGRIRESDIQGRIGGEEFALVLPDTNAEGAASVAEEIRLAIQNSVIMTGELKVRVTASFGVSQLEKETDDIHAILKRADDALYRAKKAGRNTVTSY
ncbi:GGDEF domain-containing protein [Leucothrix sargassi]|nr:GGDEF domain-containing protein [Leucothrix sargassi]